MAKRFSLSYAAPVFQKRRSWRSLIAFFLVTLFTQIAPTRAEVSMTFNGYELITVKGHANFRARRRYLRKKGNKKKRYERTP